MPVPMVNILSGGHHAGFNIEIQDFLVIPRGFATYAESLEALVAVHRAARLVLEARGMILTGVADEGGWGPRLRTNEDGARRSSTPPSSAPATNPEGRWPSPSMWPLLTSIAPGRYVLRQRGPHLTSAEMTVMLERWIARYPMVSIEDALAEDDWDGWRRLTRGPGDRVQLIGDDLFATNLARLERGIGCGVANAVLVKMNQIGTLTETFAVIDRARAAGYRAVISARSGETEDDFLADLAVASGAGQIKVGSVRTSERLAKYNRLLKIEQALQIS